jgi:hypothetical protein
MKPVAWIDPKELDMDVSTSVTKNKQFDTDIPLYAHPVKELKNIVVASATCSCGKVMEVTNLQPVKELTDEDYKEALACLQFALNDTMDYLTLNNLGGENNHWLVWARAILRKAQEK